MSLLLAHGHPEAAFYPIALVGEEASIVSSRENNRIASEAVVFQSAVSAAIGSAFGKGAGAKAFAELIKRLQTDGQ